MVAPDSKSLSWTAPVMVFVLQFPHGLAQTLATVGAATATTAFIYLAARFVWMPVFKKKGLRRAAVWLGIAIVAGLLATAIAGALKLGDPGGFAWHLAENCAVVGLLFSWGIAAIRGAERKTSPTLPESQRSASVLFRPSPRRFGLPS